ncbi:hypothetical protein J8273_4640 [Carpediemonas membranifera]|uniref:Uncharacterized protein n=1 Tax=Carpediemonas membranifera TaxID=201153 RepID=A0A8J6BBA7_9EUKA|nr:hypothetical protein J8273_4640 [Carpediemonas membranifera]|eukprot:KAG9393777.1 hypothetical protein J8273_4640 [Carpediemonas membranifera]
MRPNEVMQGLLSDAIYQLVVHEKVRKDCNGKHESLSPEAFFLSRAIYRSRPINPAWGFFFLSSKTADYYNQLRLLNTAPPDVLVSCIDQIPQPSLHPHTVNVIVKDLNPSVPAMLPIPIAHCTSLESLGLVDCYRVHRLPKAVGQLPIRRIAIVCERNMPVSPQSDKRIIKRPLVLSASIRSLPKSLITMKLSVLELRGLPRLNAVPPLTASAPTLKRLIVSGCDGARVSLTNCPVLEQLLLADAQVVAFDNSCRSLSHLSLSDVTFHHAEWCGDLMRGQGSLVHLFLDCLDITAVEHIGSQHTVNVTLSNCPQLVTVPEIPTLGRFLVKNCPALHCDEVIRPLTGLDHGLSAFMWADSCRRSSAMVFKPEDSEGFGAAYDDEDPGMNAMRRLIMG